MPAMALLAAGERLFFKPPLMSRLAENRVCCGKEPVLPCALAENEKRILKAGTVPHTSTNFLAVWKTCAATFPLPNIHYSNLSTCQVPRM
jgi:hypothetical protein